MSAVIGQPAPDFRLRELDGREHLLSEYRGRIVILNFWSCECPHSERADRSILEKMEAWGGAVFLLSIASNRNESLEALRIATVVRLLPLVLLDAEQQVADLYGAQTTPHLFVIDKPGFLRYRGALDDLTFRHRIPTRSYLVEAVEALLAGRLPPLSESPAYGCAIVREI